MSHQAFWDALHAAQVRMYNEQQRVAQIVEGDGVPIIATTPSTPSPVPAGPAAGEGEADPSLAPSPALPDDGDQ